LVKGEPMRVFSGVKRVCIGLCVVIVSGPVVLAQSPQSLDGHTDPVYDAVFTPDGRWVVTASFDKTLRLWDLASRQSVRTMSGHTGLVLSIAVDPGGGRIASGAMDNTIKIWDVPINSPITDFAGHSGPVRSVAMTGDGQWIISGGSDKSVQLRATADGKVVRAFEGHLAGVVGVAVRSDSLEVATATESGVLRLFTLADGKPIGGSVVAHPGPITGLLYARNNSFLVTSGSDGLVRKWPRSLPATLSASGHSAPIASVDVSSTGSMVATASLDKTARLWRRSDGTLLRPLESHPAQVTSIAFSPNSSQVATGSADQIVRLFTVSSGKLQKAFPAQAGPISCVSLSANGQLLVAGDTTGSVVLYKIADGSVQAKLAGHTAAITGVSFTANSAQVVTTSRDKNLRVFGSADGKLVRTIATGSEALSLSVSANGVQAAVGGSDKAVRVYTLSDGKLTKTLGGHESAVTAVEFSRDNTKLLSGSGHGRLRAWDLKTDRVLQHFRTTGAISGVGFSNDNRTIAFAGTDTLLHIEAISVQVVIAADDRSVDSLGLSGNSAVLVTAGPGGVKSWNSGSGQPIRTFAGLSGGSRAVSMNASSNQLAAADGTSLCVWNASNGELQLKIPTPSPVTGLAYTVDNKKLLAVSLDHSIRSYDPTAPNPKPPVAPSRDAAQLLSGHTGDIHGLALALDNTTLVTASADGTVKTWTVAATGFSQNYTGHGGYVAGLAYSPDGTRLASASSDKTVRLWDTKTHKVIRTLSTQPSQVYAVSFSPDGKFVVTGGADKTVRLINVETGAEVRKYTGPTQAVYSVAFSPDGKTIAGAGVGLGGKRSVYLWDLGNPKPSKQIEGHTGDIYRVRFHPTKGDRLLTADYSGVIHIWDTVSGKSLFTTRLANPPIYSAAYSNDGKQIVAGARDAKAYLIPVPAAAQ
jgi:WD40 repeat protein